LSAHWLIAEAVEADAESLAALHAGALPPGWPALELAACCGDTSRALLKAAEGERLHGFALLQFAADEAEILAFAVARESRGQGCAASLMRAAINLCASRFVTCIYLEVAESNEPARGLYEKFGFMAVARRKNYYRSASSAPETALIMKLRRDAFPSVVDQERSGAQ
jgi:ribosomal-protein-alanine N-acetyltransferase